MNPFVSVFDGVDFRRGCLYRTTDLEEARLVCGRVFNPHDLKIVGRGQCLKAGMDHLRLGPLSLNRLDWGAAVAVDPGRLDDYYLISMPLRGHARFDLGGRVTDVSVRCAGIVNASQRFRFVASDDFEQIVIRVDRHSVESGWQALSGEVPTSPIDFECAVQTRGDTWRALQPLMEILARRARSTMHVHPHFDARLEEMLVATLLLNQSHNLGAQALQQPARAVPWHLSRAEAHMLERLHEPMTVGQVARVCGVSTRTLQAAFNEEHGVGPMQWLRDQRLHAVRAALLASQENQPNIAQIALHFGFTHLGEFCLAYRRRFGETARSTLRRRL